MRRHRHKLALVLAAAVILTPLSALADEAAEAALKTEVELLKAQLAAQAARIERLEARQASAPAVAATPAAPILLTDEGAAAPSGGAGSAPAASVADATTIGGYGEVAYNAYLKDSSRNQADLQRFVLFFGHRFSDRISFNSEFEVEHAVASADDQGEAEVEQAYLNFQLSSAASLRAGLFLMPFGFINRSHEPPTYYGVERNEVERRIIPSTWREGGVSLYGSTPFGLDYDVGVTTGFDVAKLDDAGAPLGSTHQELQLAHAANLSVYGSVDWRGLPGLDVGGGVFTGDTGQKNADFRSDPSQPDFRGVSARMTLWDAHARYQSNGFDMQAVYTQGTFSQAARLDAAILAYNQANGTDRPVVPSAFYGWLVQGAYTYTFTNDMAVSPFLRYERYDTQASLPLDLVADPANRDKILTMGLSFRPLSDVVVKADYQKFFDNSENDRINLGLGYMF
jgi:hypothetical protein